MKQHAPITDIPPAAVQAGAKAISGSQAIPHEQRLVLIAECFNAMLPVFLAERGLVLVDREDALAAAQLAEVGAHPLPPSRQALAERLREAAER